MAFLVEMRTIAVKILSEIQNKFVDLKIFVTNIYKLKKMDADVLNMHILNSVA